MANQGVATLSDLEIIFSRILNIVITLAGIAAFVMIIVGGFKYLMSGGDPKQAESAQATITWAVIGLVIAIASWFILKFIQQFTGIPEDQFFNFSITGS